MRIIALFAFLVAAFIARAETFKAGSQLSQIELVPLTIEEDLSQGDRPEPINA
jgi:hypothetical protein